MASSKRKSFLQASRQQPTIQQHFDISERKSALSATVSRSPDSKRRKLDNQIGVTSPITKLSSGDMYNFGTSEPTPVQMPMPNGASPKARRISNLGTLSMNDANEKSFGTRKLVVKNLRPSTAPKTSDYVAETSRTLEAALTAIFNNEQPTRSNEELYKGAENICKLGFAADLAKMVDRRCKEHISTSVRPTLARKADDKDVEVLRAVVAAWKVWDAQSVGQKR